ncbi:MAG: glycosyltransferase family 4 protein [Anaeromyxobacteraceae bacterium]
MAYERRPSPARLRALYNEAAVFLAPSWTEGFGLTPAEAMACGAAVVATDAGGFREFAHDGETALVVPARAPEALAAALLRLVRDPALRVRLARAGHALIQGFTWARAADGLEAILRDAIGREATPPRT